MLIKLFPKLGDNIMIKYLKKGLECKYSAILIAALIFASNLFAWDIPMMYVLVALWSFATLFADDMLCMMPFACGIYFLFSRDNNPLHPNQTSIFLSDFGKTQLWICAILLAVFGVARLIFDVIRHKERRKFPLLSLGFLALGVSYVLGGLFTDGYALDTAFFGLVQIVAICIAYFYFYYTVDLKKIDKRYFAYLMCVVGVLLCGEVLVMLYQSGFFTTDGAFNRFNLYTGWGIYNNVAGAMIMCLPAPFYYATVKKSGWPFLLLGNLFYVTILFIQSRGGMLFGSCIYILCILFTFLKSDRKKTLLIIQIAIWMSIFFVCLFFQKQIVNMFYSIIQHGIDDGGRFDIYKSGLNQFLDAPFFGNGWYACETWRWGDNTLGKFLPPRYHNTIIQLLASGGIVMFLAYAFHRFQTVQMIFKKRTLEKYFIGLCLLGLLLTSLLDCHFFNFGPGLTYGTLLILLEADWLREETPAAAERFVGADSACVMPYPLDQPPFLDQGRGNV